MALMLAQSPSPWSSTNATAPYDPAGTLADVILRSSDDVDFYVFGGFLRYVSLTFRAMFALNSNQTVEGDEIKDGHPVIPVEEDSKTLRLLLDSIYPTSEERPLDDVGLFWKVAKASQKYCMEIVEEKFRKRALASDLVKSCPLSMYAVATGLGWDEVAIAAARQTLEIPLESLPYVNELESITGAGFYRFVEYRLRCQKSSDPTAEDLKKFPTVARPCSIPTDTDNISDAPAPFDSSAPADLILRSSDSVDFFVLGGLMRRLSPVFKDMFPLQSDHPVKNGMPVAHVEESSDVLHCLLSVIYHDLDEPDLKKGQLYIQVLLALRNYKITTIEQRLRKQARRTFSQPIWIPNWPPAALQVYIVATVLGWGELATTAKGTYRTLDELPHLEELQLISGADLYQYVQSQLPRKGKSKRSFHG